jgi:hypothetical protein
MPPVVIPATVRVLLVDHEDVLTPEESSRNQSTSHAGGARWFAHRGELCEHEFDIRRGTKDGFPPFVVAVCVKCLGAWRDGRLQMPWTLGEPAWWWTEGGVLLPGPQTDIDASALPLSSG